MKTLKIKLTKRYSDLKRQHIVGRHQPETVNAFGFPIFASSNQTLY